MSKIAWSGELLLLEAKWTDKDGHLAKFKLVSPNEARPNPFKAFTKRKKGRAGTRFEASLAHVGEVRTDHTAYNGQMMLAGWADTSTQGYTVTFWVEPPEPLTVHHLDQELTLQDQTHKLAGYERNKDSFMAVLVELDDDDQPIDQDLRERVEKATTKIVPVTLCSCEDPTECTDVHRERLTFGVRCRRLQEIGDQHTQALVDSVVQAKKEHLEKHGAEIVERVFDRRRKTLSNYAAMLCLNKDFWEWVNETQLGNVDPRVFDKDTAAEWMRNKLGIDSRADIDTMDVKAKMYHELVRKPFAVWHEERYEHS